MSSSLGFEVHEAFPRYLEYREGPCALRFTAEPAPGGASDVILLFDGAGADRWQPPHDARPITDEKKHQILVRVSAALTLLGKRPEWQTFSPLGPRSDWAAIRAEATALLRYAERPGDPG